MENNKKIMRQEMLDAEFCISKPQGGESITCHFEGSAFGIRVSVIKALMDLCNKDQALREVLMCGILGLLDEIKEAEEVND